MRALSLHRPWPYAIVHGGKRIENRTHEITYRGDVVFQAAKRFDKDAVPLIQSNMRAAGLDPFGCSGYTERHPAGVLAFVAQITDCMPVADFHRLIGADSLEWMIEQRRWAFGPWCAVLDNIRPLPPISWKGSQGWFDVPDSIVLTALRDTVRA